jgi:flagellar biosynthetic protein FliO
MNTVLLAVTDVSLAGPDLVPPIWRTAAALALVLAMLIGLGWLLRKAAQGRRHRRPLSIEAALALGERRSLAIVTVEGRRLLLGLAPNYVSLVTELTAAPSFDQAVTTAIAREVQP